MDTVYILRHLVGREIRNEGGRMYALFIDLPLIALDAYPVTKMEEIYEETVSKVREDGIQSESFYTNRGVRQGCLLSPALFAAYLGYIDEMFRKTQTGRVVVIKE